MNDAFLKFSNTLVQAVSLKIATIKSQHAMAEAMKGVTKAMQRMNKNMKLPQIQKLMQGMY